ncbi:MAG: hypothetical protein V1650_04230 [Candidatus Omnitrophota bacterium]
MTSNSIVVFLVFAIMPILLIICQKFFSTKQVKEDQQYNTEELTAKFKNRDTANLIIGWVLMVISMFVWYQVLIFLANQQNKAIIEASKFFVPVSFGIWVLVAMFLGIVSGAALAFMSQILLLGKDFPLYIRYYNIKYGFDAFVMLKLMLIGVSVIAFIASILSFNFYSSFTGSGIVIGKIFGKVQYAYSEVSQVKYVLKFRAPNGNIKENPYFVIYFNDGRKWSSRDRGYNSVTKNQALIEFVLGQSNKSLTEVDFDS